jgi:uncharacterized phiE125 gp8 family phage protein
MASILLAAPAAEPITLAEAKLYLRVEHADDDALIGALITAARTHVETRTRRALITQTWRFVFDRWPRDGRLTLARAAARDVVAARVYDNEDVAHDVDTNAFVVDKAAAPALIGFAPWAVPFPGRSIAGIELDVTLGYGAAASDVPEPLRQALRLLLAHWYENRGITQNGNDAAPMTAGVEALIAPYRVLSL